VTAVSRQGLAILAIIPIYLTIRRLLRRPTRVSKISMIDERILILGASSGIGRTIARLYAERGARVCVVGRRQTKIQEVVEECRNLGVWNSSYGASSILGLTGDFADVDDMVRIRAILETGTHDFLVYYDRIDFPPIS
jgi:NAD(P)-dependent dehydrogenase (short-subunit alcohol dehydrogenase family)